MKRLSIILLLLTILLSLTLVSCANCGSQAKATKELCNSCGEIKGSENCCKVDAEKCEKCGKNLGSPGCCK